jgi:hypothetical protein
MSSGLESKLPISISELSGLVNGDHEALIFKLRALPPPVSCVHGADHREAASSFEQAGDSLRNR